MADEKTQIITEEMTLYDDFHLDETYLISTGLESTGVIVASGSLTDTLITSAEQKKIAPEGYYLSIEIVASAIQSSLATSAQDAWAAAVTTGSN